MFRNKIKRELDRKEDLGHVNRTFGCVSMRKSTEACDTHSCVSMRKSTEACDTHSRRVSWYRSVIQVPVESSKFQPCLDTLAG